MNFRDFGDFEKILTTCTRAKKWKFYFVFYLLLKAHYGIFRRRINHSLFLYSSWWYILFYLINKDFSLFFTIIVVNFYKKIQWLKKKIKFINGKDKEKKFDRGPKRRGPNGWGPKRQGPNGGAQTAGPKRGPPGEIGPADPPDSVWTFFTCFSVRVLFPKVL